MASIEIKGADEVLFAIGQGQYDDRLDEIADAIRERHKAIARQLKDELKVGDRIVFNDRTRPKYLQGVEATVESKRNTRILVRLDEPVGKFLETISTSPELVDRA